MVTTFNEEDHIRDLMDSLVVQKEIHEIIVVDSESTDKTWEILKKYEESFENVYIYRKKSTRGEGRNSLIPFWSMSKS